MVSIFALLATGSHVEYPSAHAEETTGTSTEIYSSSGTSSASEEKAKFDYEEICGTVVDEKSCELAAAATVTADSQKFYHCQAACAAKKAKDKSLGLGIAWGSVAAVCTGACVSSLAGMGTEQLVCIGASVAGGVATGIVEKDFAQAIMGLAGAAGSFMINKTIGKDLPANPSGKDENLGAESVSKTRATDDVKPPKDKDKDIGACVAAATAGIQTFTRFKTMSESNKTLQASLASAAAEDSTGTSTSGTTTTTPSGSGSGTDTTTTGGTTTTASATGESSSSDTGSCTTNATSGTMACAAATDGNMPSWVTSPKFEKEFEDQTGVKLSDYLNSGANDPREILGATMGSGLAMG
ncbi:MAG: hypothetical protein AAB425_14290, partial [Bdellovibrionota bacterium]